MAPTVMLASIAPHLPVTVDTQNQRIAWPEDVSSALKAVARGPDLSGVQDGKALDELVAELRYSNGLAQLYPDAGKGMHIFFDRVISQVEANKFFVGTLPAMANLALKLPSLLEQHIITTAFQQGSFGIPLHLRVLCSQNAGIVLLSQELVASLLVCAFFCLYPPTRRRKDDLSQINFDFLFGYIVHGREHQIEKLKCLVHYFERICDSIPSGAVSYERKVLDSDQSSLGRLPDHSFWDNCKSSLCEFKVRDEGVIEEVGSIALQVDFANSFFGGGALGSGCVQEEIRFMINPELIAGMLFLECMSDNEAIEVVGAEMYSRYEGYGASFSFAGDFVDKESKDGWGRHCTRIVAIDALPQAGEKQFKSNLILRELNKAFCGFLDHSTTLRNLPKLKVDAIPTNMKNIMDVARTSSATTYEDIDVVTSEVTFQNDQATTSIFQGFQMHSRHGKVVEFEGEKNNISVLGETVHIVAEKGNSIGVATGNWGCGAFGGDLELKSILQWLAASQAGRPFLLYFTFGDPHAKRLQEVVHWILKEDWSVSELWGLLMVYANRRRHQQVKTGLFEWLLPKGWLGMGGRSNKETPSIPENDLLTLRIDFFNKLLTFTPLKSSQVFVYKNVIAFETASPSEYIIPMIRVFKADEDNKGVLFTTPRHFHKHVNVFK